MHKQKPMNCCHALDRTDPSNSNTFLHMHEIGYQKCYSLVKILNSLYFLETCHTNTSVSHLNLYYFCVTNIGNVNTPDGTTRFFLAVLREFEIT